MSQYMFVYLTSRSSSFSFSPHFAFPSSRSALALVIFSSTLEISFLRTCNFLLRNAGEFNISISFFFGSADCCCWSSSCLVVSCEPSSTAYNMLDEECLVLISSISTTTPRRLNVTVVDDVFGGITNGVKLRTAQRQRNASTTICWMNEPMIAINQIIPINCNLITHQPADQKTWSFLKN